MTWMLSADTDMPALRRLLGDGSVAVVTIAQALHWMRHEELFQACIPLLRAGGGVAVVTNGTPLWLQDTDWSRALRGFLEQWRGAKLAGACGTDEQSQRELAQAVVAKHMPRDAVADAVRSRVGKRNVAPKAGRLSCKLDGGISVTVTSGEPLTWDHLIAALDQLKKQARKLCEDGKEISALSRLLRAS